MKFLKSHAERAKLKGRLKTLLDKNLHNENTPHSVAGFMHASTLTNAREFCAREIRLLDKTGKKLQSSPIETALQITFDEGWDKQWRLSNDWLRNEARGVWKCRSCLALSKFGPAPDMKKCYGGTIKCQWDYTETVVKDLERQITGGVDLIVDAGEPLLRSVECKIMAQTMFKTLKAPLGEHRLRTNLYLRLLARNPILSSKVNTDEATVLYICRGHGTQQNDGEISPFKEFVVERDDSKTDYLFERAGEVAATRKTGKIPKERICPTAMCDRAKKCPVKKECFGGKYG